MLSLEPLYADMEGAGLGKQQWGLLDEGFSWDVTVHSETGLTPLLVSMVLTDLYKLLD